MVLIYALVSGEEVLYVGQTIQTLKRRASEHRSAGNQTGSRNIPPDVQWEIKLLEECEENATVRERHYVETFNPPYNKIIPGRTPAEYRQTDVAKAIQRAYGQTEARKAYLRAYRQTEAAKALHRERKRKYYLKKKAEREAARL